MQIEINLEMETPFHI